MSREPLNILKRRRNRNFADAFGDRNGALQRVNEKYQNLPAGRYSLRLRSGETLIEQLPFLMRAGIKPSTIIIAAHGRPGETYFGEGQDRFVFATSEKQTTKAFDADKVSPKLRKSDKDLVCDFMQDSRVSMTLRHVSIVVALLCTLVRVM